MRMHNHRVLSWKLPVPLSWWSKRRVRLTSSIWWLSTLRRDTHTILTLWLFNWHKALKRLSMKAMKGSPNDMEPIMSAESTPVLSSSVTLLLRGGTKNLSIRSRKQSRISSMTSRTQSRISSMTSNWTVRAKKHLKAWITTHNYSLKSKYLEWTLMLMAKLLSPSVM